MKVDKHMNCSGIGIDSVEIERFAHWPVYSHAQLQRIFSPQEIEYCMQQPVKSAERLAARFAAREALWKAICQVWPEHTMSFLGFCRSIQVAHSERGVPYFILNEDYFKGCIPRYSAETIQLSLTHTRTTATAMVIICKK